MPKKPKQLPAVLNKEEIASNLNVIKNIKHKTMLMLGYGCGLRVSEITNLTINDIDGKMRLLFIKKAKGKKDRVISLSPALLIIPREYYKQYKPSTFLFEGAAAEAEYSVRSLETIIQTAKEKAGIRKAGSKHMLRHSFATYLLDKGTDVVLIQKLLGHNDIKTTLRYLHVINKDLLNILSPIEDIQVLLT
jgi:integrase/recombinase XerD